MQGEEGALSLTTKEQSPYAVVKGRPLNYCAGFRPQKIANEQCRNPDGLLREAFALEVKAQDYGIAPTSTPRTDRSVRKNLELGLAALRGEKGPAYDRIVLNAAVADHLLGCDGAEDPIAAAERAKEAIDSGKALNALLKYIECSQHVS
jgi:anthranilate phosphoribosyltransferase